MKITSILTRRSFFFRTNLNFSQQLINDKVSSSLYRPDHLGRISFLKSPPLSQNSPTILGTLSSKSHFNENPGFIELLHSVLMAAYLDDPHVLDLASSRKSSSADSYLHVVGTRTNNQAVNDRDPASIIFSFLASSTTGLPVPNTYARNPAMRIYTPLDGFLILPPSLHQAVIRGCQIARKIEEQSES